MLNVAPSGQSALHFIAASADVAGPNVLIHVTLRNDTGGAVVLAASPRLGAMPRPMSSPSPVAAGATATVVVPLVNVPPGTHAIEIRVFDVQDPTLELLLVGTLAVTPESAPAALSLTTTTTTAAGTGPLVPPPPGLESRITRTQSVEASAGRFTVDLDASTDSDIALSCAVTISIETTESESLVARGWGGRFGLGNVDTQYAITRREALATLQVKAPLETSVEAATQAVGVRCDLAAAVVTMSSADSDLQRAIPELSVSSRRRSQRTALNGRRALASTSRPGCRWSAPCGQAKPSTSSRFGGQRPRAAGCSRPDEARAGRDDVAGGEHTCTRHTRELRGLGRLRDDRERSGGPGAREIPLARWRPSAHPVRPADRKRVRRPRHEGACPGSCRNCTRRVSWTAPRRWHRSNSPVP